jgi:manganese/zinc/iron transport system ATP- binding protein
MPPLELVETGAAPETAPLSVRGLTVTYREKPALFSVDARFAPGR